jgi:uncharacterized iron-regulated membrane protein
VSMPWWLGLPVLVVWGLVVVGIYLVVGLLWAIWLLGHGVTQLVSRSSAGVDESSPAIAPPPLSTGDLLPPTSMSAEVPKELADLRSRFQAELEATRSLPDLESRLQAELDVRTRFDAALKARLPGSHDPSTPSIGS